MPWDLHKPQTPCIQKAWQAFEASRFEESIKVAQSCIENYLLTAEAIQREIQEAGIPCCPTGKVNKQVKKACDEQGILNDIAAAYFIKSQALLELLLVKKRQSLADYQEAIHAMEGACRLKCGKVWDVKKRFFWSPCEGIKMELEHLKPIVEKGNLPKLEDLYNLESHLFKQDSFRITIPRNEDPTTLLAEAEMHMIGKKYRMALRNLFRIRNYHFYSWIARFADFQIAFTKSSLGWKKEAIQEFSHLIKRLSAKRHNSTLGDMELDMYQRSLWFSTNLYYQTKQYQNAILDGKSLLELEPDNVELLYLVGICHLEINQPIEAKTNFEQAITKDPYNGKLWDVLKLAKKELYFLEGKDNLDRGNFKDAVVSYSQYLNLSPNDYAGFFNRGLANFNLKDYKGAISDFEQASKLRPKEPSPYFFLGSCFYLLNANQEALSYLDKSIRFGQTGDVFLKRAIVHRELGNFLDAISDFSTALENGSGGSINLFYYRGECYYSLQDWGKAVEDFSSSIKQTPDEEQAYIKKIYACAWLKKTNTLCFTLKDLFQLKGLSITPFYQLCQTTTDFDLFIHTLFDLAEITLSQNPEIAELIYEISIILQPSYVPTYHAMGAKKHLDGEFELAVSYFDTYIFFRPKTI